MNTKISIRKPPFATLSLAAILWGCGEGGDSCTDIAWVSLSVQTVDSSGAPMAVDSVVYSLNGGETQQAVADQVGDYPLWNGPGTYDVTAIACGGLQTQTGSYDVPDGPCGSDTATGIASLELVFEPCGTQNTSPTTTYSYGT